MKTLSIVLLLALLLTCSNSKSLNEKTSQLKNIGDQCMSYRGCLSKT